MLYCYNIYSIGKLIYVTILYVYTFKIYLLQINKLNSFKKISYELQIMNIIKALN